jgi:hypothetical protein
MEPAASKIERKTAGMGRPGTTANAAPRLENKRTNRSRGKPGGRRYSRCPRADYYDIDFVHIYTGQPTPKPEIESIAAIWCQDLGDATCIPDAAGTPA